MERETAARPVDAAPENGTDACATDTESAQPSWLTGIIAARYRDLPRTLIQCHRDIARSIADARAECASLGLNLDKLQTDLSTLDENPAAADLFRSQQAIADSLQEMAGLLGRTGVGIGELLGELSHAHLRSYTDDFTGLPNRRAFMHKLDEEMARARRYGSPLALAVIDLDRFKIINDVHGHAAGDEVLRLYAARILRSTRRNDVVARYGGEEFVAIFPNTDADGAAQALAGMRARVPHTPPPLVGVVAVDLPTFSAGVAVFRDEDGAEDLVGRADRALYRAKRKGRDRIEIARSEPQARNAEKQRAGG
jgi:diguanylate cyclase (GGDEF)-like protein